MSREFCAKISSIYLLKWRPQGKNSDFWCDSWFEGHEQVVKVISFSTRDVHVRTSHTKFEVFIFTAFWNISTQNVEKSPLDYNGEISLPWQRAMLAKLTILQDLDIIYDICNCEADRITNGELANDWNFRSEPSLLWPRFTSWRKHRRPPNVWFFFSLNWISFTLALVPSRYDHYWLRYSNSKISTFDLAVTLTLIQGHSKVDHREISYVQTLC